MADVGHASEENPAYLGRLHLRFPKGYRPKTEQRSPEELSGIYKNRDYIRSKYKGSRHPETGGTSGIPIFGNEDAAERANWSIGHTAARQGLQTDLIRQAASTQGVSPMQVAAENSHALGHADYGTDHELSAPAASKAQNTEQLAIELAMRAAAKELNQGQDPDVSLVHAKITDVLHPKTGQLMARRFKLIRREDAGDKDGKVVFDHLMDGQQFHISKEDAFARGKQAYEALISGQPADRVVADYQERVRKEKSGGKAKGSAGGGSTGKDRFDRKGMRGATAPTRDALLTHQVGTLGQLQKNRRDLKKAAASAIAPVSDRRGVAMIGPAFTEAQFPGELGPERKSGQEALDEHRARMGSYVSDQGQEAESLLQSGGLPAGDEASLMQHVGVLEHAFGPELGEAGSLIEHGITDTPSEDHIREIGGMVGSKFNPRQMGVQDRKDRLTRTTNGAVRALKALEGEKSGSGLGLLTEEQKKLLMAAHMYQGATLGESAPVLPPPADSDMS